MDARRPPGQFRDLDPRPRARARSSRHPGGKRRRTRGVYARLREAGGTIIKQGETACCYAKSEKSWIDDPAGIAWETFFTTGESISYGEGSGEREARVAHEKSSAFYVPSAAPVAAAPTCCAS
jgi:hypothetical protein